MNILCRRRIILSMMFVTFIDNIRCERKTFKAVSAFPDLNRLYLRMRIRDPSIVRRRTTRDIKSAICLNITRSAYFDNMLGEDGPINPNDVHRELIRLKPRYANILNHFLLEESEENLQMKSKLTTSLSKKRPRDESNDDRETKQMGTEGISDLNIQKCGTRVMLPDLNMDADTEMNFDDEEDDIHDMDVSDSGKNFAEEDSEILAHYSFIDIHHAYGELETQFSFTIKPSTDKGVKRSRSSDRSYNNPTKLIRVNLGPVTVSEYTFSCLTRNRRTRKINQYYVSESYRMDRNLDAYYKTTSIRMFGYFIFQFVYDTYVLRGLAEESAVVADSQRSRVEKYYLQMRKHYHPAVQDYEDPICSLPKSMKFRICTSVFSSSDIENKVTYLTDFDLFDENCEKFEIDIRKIKEKSDTETTYQEWMLYCSVEPVKKSGPSAEYFISRSYNSRIVFVYIRDYETRKLYLENLSKNVNLVVDKCKAPHCLKV